MRLPALLQTGGLVRLVGTGSPGVQVGLLLAPYRLHQAHLDLCSPGGALVGAVQHQRGPLMSLQLSLLLGAGASLKHRSYRSAGRAAAPSSISVIHHQGEAHRGPSWSLCELWDPGAQSVTQISGWIDVAVSGIL